MPFIIYMFAIAVFAQGTSEFMLAGLVPDISRDVGVSISEAGLLTSAFAVGMIVGAPSMAALSRRWPPRWTLAGFLVLFIGVHVLGAMTTSFELLLVTRVVAAVANAGFLAVALSTVAAMVAPEVRARALAAILAGTTLALIAGVPIGAALGTALGWRSALWGVAAVSVPALLAVLIYTPTRTDGDERGRVGSLMLEFRSLGRPALATVLVLGALVNGATFCAFTYLAPLVTGVSGLAEAAVPVVLAVFGVGAFIGVTFAGRFADHHSTTIVAGGGLALLAGWIVFTVTAENPVAMFVLAFVQGVLSFAVGSALIARIMYAATDAPTVGGSFATTSLNVGAAIGPAIGSLAFAGNAGALGPLMVSAILVLLAVMLGVLAFAVGRRTETEVASSG
jgi:MFS transporter, DHA1 family, chloramphenicol resistance protein